MSWPFRALAGSAISRVQFARRMGFHTVAIARGKDKANLARDLGAHVYIDSETQDAAEELTALGGAKVILTTVTSGKAMTPLIDGLGDRRHAHRSRRLAGTDRGQPVPRYRSAQRGVRGWPSGTSVDSEDTLRFSALTGVEAMIETYPLTRAAEAYQRMLSGKARFRVVIVP